MKILYIHIPKCAGMAMRELFPLPSGCPVEMTHYTLYAWSKYLSPADEYRTLAVVRNPFDRFVSAFSYLKQQNPSHRFWRHDKANRAAIERYATANEAAEDCASLLHLQHFKPQYIWGAHECDMLVRYEDMESVFPNLPRTNTSKHNHWRQEIRGAGECAIALAYSKDFETYGYTTGGM